MGNCISSPHFPPLQKIKEFMGYQGQVFEKFAASGAYKGLNLTSQAFTTSSAVLEDGPGAAPPAPAPAPVLIHDDGIVKPADFCKLPKATIVVSKEQLELLLKNSKQFRSKGIAVQFSDSFKFDESGPKWCPALPTIPEVLNY